MKNKYNRNEPSTATFVPFLAHADIKFDKVKHCSNHTPNLGIWWNGTT